MSESKFPQYPILIVDDEPIILESLELTLNIEGYNNLILCQDSREVEDIISNQDISVIFLDLMMPHISGEELLNKIKSVNTEIPVVIITAISDVETTVRCMKASAFDYLVKPIDENRLITTLTRSLQFRELRTEVKTLKNHLLQDQLNNPDSFSHIVTQNKKLISGFQYIESVALSNQPVLIHGETGVGKELIARAVHNASGRTGEFVALNIAGLDENVFSDTLFGHEKGAFTGADTFRPGLIEKGIDGTLFLDEIGDLRMDLQTKLLRLIETRDYFPLGSDVPKKTNIRIICATNRDLKKMSEANQFRSDLYFRLNSHQVSIPPLRDRMDDLPILVNHFLEEAAKELNKPVPTPPAELITLLVTYHYPGNVRELKAMVFDAVAKHKSKMLSLSTFKEYISKNSVEPDIQYSEVNADDKYYRSTWKHLPTIKQNNKMLIRKVLDYTKGNQSVAAQILGISRQTLARYLKEYEMVLSK